MKIQSSVYAIAVFLLFMAYSTSAQDPYVPTPVKAEIEGNIIVAKLVDGDSLIPKIIQISQKFGLSSGMVLFSIGQLREFSVGQFNTDSGRYVHQFTRYPWELVSLQGTIADGFDGIGGLQVNCQATLADSLSQVIGGHLKDGIVSLINEVVILKLKDVSLVRKYNLTRGLWELDVAPR